jgi:hypothetical protein
LGQVGLYNAVEHKFWGPLQVGGLNFAELFSGLAQVGGLNYIGDEIYGGQLGLANMARSIVGVQIGLFNYARKLRGLQIGVLNMSRDGGLPIMVLVNAGF